MKLYRYIILFTLAFTLIGCGGDDGLNHAPTSKQDKQPTSQEISDDYVYQLPVIFHVFYKDRHDSHQYIPSSRLLNIIQYVNKIYEGNHYGQSENCHLRFVMADRDESGRKLSTPGVDYVQFSQDFPIDPSQFMSDRAYTPYIWDPNQYINIMLYPFKNEKGTETLGISHMPYSLSSNHELAGLITQEAEYIDKSQLAFPLCLSINSKYAYTKPLNEMNGSTERYYQSNRYNGTNHSYYTIDPSDVIVTTAHELGHYLGLFHVFSEKQDDTQTNGMTAEGNTCHDSDHCADTPSYDRKQYEALMTKLNLDFEKVLMRQSCDGSTYKSTNIMDYAYTMGYQITPNQKARIRHVLYYSPLIPGPKKNHANINTRARRETPKRMYTRSVIMR